MNLKLKRILRVVLCIVFSMVLLCGCKNGKAGTSGKNEHNKKEYVARITAYKEYYEDIENDYYCVEGMILVREDGMPYMLLRCVVEEDVSNYKIQLIDFKDGNAELCGEKDFYYDGTYFSLSVAELNNRCIIKIFGDNEIGEEYWEFVEDNLLAQKLREAEIAKLEKTTSRSYVCDVSEKPYKYLYTYDRQNQKVSIYDKESDIDTVNKIALDKIHNYMQLSDEQKEYLVITTNDYISNKPLTTNFVNVFSMNTWNVFHMKGVTLKQYLNELSKEPLYHIEDIAAKEYGFGERKGVSAEEIERRKEREIDNINKKMPLYNPYSTDKHLLQNYYLGIREICFEKGHSMSAGGYTIDETCLPYEATDLATLMGMYKVTQALDVMFEENPLKYDYIFTSDEFKGATWKDITFNGSHKYPVLTLTKNGNTLSYSTFDGYVEFRQNPELKRAIEAYAECPEISNDAAFAFVYIDEDDIPEMITAYRVYSYENGQLIAEELNPDQWVGGYIPKGNSIAIFEEDYIYEEDGTSYRDGKYTQYSIVDDDIKYVKDIKWTEEYEPVTFEKDIISALEKIYSLRNE